MAERHSLVGLLHSALTALGVTKEGRARQVKEGKQRLKDQDKAKKTAEREQKQQHAKTKAAVRDIQKQTKELEKKHKDHQRLVDRANKQAHQQAKQSAKAHADNIKKTNKAIHDINRMTDREKRTKERALQKQGRDEQKKMTAATKDVQTIAKSQSGIAKLAGKGSAQKAHMKAMEAHGKAESHFRAVAKQARAQGNWSAAAKAQLQAVHHARAAGQHAGHAGIRRDTRGRFA